MLFIELAIIIMVVGWIIKVLVKGFAHDVRDISDDVRARSSDRRNKEVVISNWNKVVREKGLDLSNKAKVNFYMRDGNQTHTVPYYIWREKDEFVMFMDNPANWIKIGDGFEPLTYEENLYPMKFGIETISQIYRLNNLCHLRFKNGTTFDFNVEAFSELKKLCPEAI